MDINTKLYGLTEQEAKAALKNIVWEIANLSPCYVYEGDSCPYKNDVCEQYKQKGMYCEDVWLNEALKEAQK